MTTQDPCHDPAAPREWTVREAGRKGGETVRDRHPGHHSRIGELGGRAVRAQYGDEHFAAISKKGGATTLAKRGPAFYSEIGRKGGAAVRDRYGEEHYSRIGKKGGAASAPRPPQEASS
ncbi:MAG TPA: hypothetical protein VEA38_04155 [Terriglobales bacterium]|nr:hypothetical protein [Terriglobales bacterium]